MVNGFVALGGVGRAGEYRCKEGSAGQQLIDDMEPPDRSDQVAGRFRLSLDRIVGGQMATVSVNDRELTHPDTFGGERWDVSYVLRVTGPGKVVFRMWARNATSIGMNEKSLVAMYFPLR